ncbi:MAG: hypothetical protein H8F28_01975 [Fibrella sp.]|nr:hypothetical protein [Armatimonadota bacterium]
MSPNRGLFPFSPILLLWFTLPFAWGKTPSVLRLITVFFLPGALLYVLFLSRLSFWNDLGWGPRYLVPVLPIFYTGAALPILVLLECEWDRRPWSRYPFLALMIISFGICLAPVMVNWDLLDTMKYPYIVNPNHSYPEQQMAVWESLYRGMFFGERLPAPDDISTDAIRDTGRDFPDLWVFRLLQHPSWGTKFIGGTALLTLTGIAVTALRFLLSSHPKTMRR